MRKEASLSRIIIRQSVRAERERQICVEILPIRLGAEALHRNSFHTEQSTQMK
jgi:hypothetical protein